ncbi:MAG: patatin-like phospholipase family protein [Bdellovibrio sp.]|nr:MAG: patatin-like phospholipase family protein [Bdellovibrio sp.]
MNARYVNPIGLVLTGGGSRGAYQAGVLKGLSEISKDCPTELCFDVLSGMSAGAINATYCATVLDQVHEGIENLCRMWASLRPQDIYRSDIGSLGKISLSWITDLSFGAFSHKKRIQHLLDTTPLSSFLKDKLQFHRIQKNIDAGRLRALSVASYCYQTEQTVSFTQGVEGLEPWSRPRRRSEFCKIGLEHVLASSAVPLLFSQVKIQDKGFFGDGSLRNTAPLSSAINLGARKILVVGVRHRRALPEQDLSVYPTVARIFGLFLNALFFDPIEVDIERLFHVNKILENTSASRQEGLPFRKIDFYLIRPSKDIAPLAEEASKNLPKTIQYLLGGLGNRKEYATLASYILFHSSFTEQLVEMGYKDCLSQKDQILEFMERESF